MADGRRLAMNLLQIQYLLDAVEMNSIHKSAEKYNISPQGASKAIKMLEQELGVILIQRSTKGVELSETGEKLLGYFQEILDDYEKIKAVCNEINMIPDPERVQGKISLAVTPRFSDTFLGSLMMKFGEAYPKIKLQVISMSHDKIFQQLQSGNDNFDLVIVNLLNVDLMMKDLAQYLNKENLQFVSCYISELYMCGKRKIIDTIGDQYHCNKDYGYPVVAYNYGRIIDRLPVKIEFMIDSMTAQLEMINKHDMIGSYSIEEFRMHFNKKKHSYIPVDEPVTLAYGYLLKNNHRLTEIEKIFVQFLLDYFDNM